jgi:hypothetical protein
MTVSQIDDAPPSDPQCADAVGIVVGALCVDSTISANADDCSEVGTLVARRQATWATIYFSNVFLVSRVAYAHCGVC